MPNRGDAVPFHAGGIAFAIPIACEAPTPIGIGASGRIGALVGRVSIGLRSFRGRWRCRSGMCRASRRGVCRHPCLQLESQSPGLRFLVSLLNVCLGMGYGFYKVPAMVATYRDNTFVLAGGGLGRPDDVGVPAPVAGLLQQDRARGLVLSRRRPQMCHPVRRRQRFADSAGTILHDGLATSANALQLFVEHGILSVQRIIRIG